MSAEKLPAEVIDVFSLFFKNFDYDIKNIQIDEDSQKASATLKPVSYTHLLLMESDTQYTSVYSVKASVFKA